jgi:hypothetical protein
MTCVLCDDSDLAKVIRGEKLIIHGPPSMGDGKRPHPLSSWVLLICHAHGGRRSPAPSDIVTITVLDGRMPR